MSFHIIFLAFSLNLHQFTCHVENTSFHFFCKYTPDHLYMYVHIVYIRTYVYRYVPIVGGIGGPSKINFGPILGQKNWGKKIAFTLERLGCRVLTAIYYALSAFGLKKSNLFLVF